MITQSVCLLRTGYTICCFLLLALCFCSYWTSAQDINTIAGKGFVGYMVNSGDGGPAVDAGIFSPWIVCSDPAGNIYISEAHTNNVRKVEAHTGLITTVAGNGTDGYGNNGDGGLAINAGLHFPWGMCTDHLGNLYIVENMGNRIRKVEAATGRISTIAGTGTSGFGGDGGPAVSANLSNPRGIRADAQDNLYVADAGNNRIRKIDAATGVISTVAGNGLPTFSGDGGQGISAGVIYPWSVCTDNNNNLFIAEGWDGISCRVRKLNLNNGVITTIAGSAKAVYSGDGGPASEANLFLPVSVCVDAYGNVYVSERDGNRIRKIDVATGTITTVAGNGLNRFSGDGGPANQSTMAYPEGICLDPIGNLYIADRDNHRIRKITGLVPHCTPAIQITASENNVCPGTAITFSAQVINGGSDPVFQWKRNGNILGSHNDSFITSTCGNKDVITCDFISSAACAAGNNNASSNSIVVSVKEETKPEVTIEASKTALCKGEMETFTAKPPYTGVYKSFQWLLNDKNVGKDTSIYTSSSLIAGDKIRCILTTENNSCPGTIAVYSNTIMPIMHEPPGIVFQPSEISITVGQNVQLSPLITGDVYSYQWSPATALIPSMSLTPQTIPVVSDIVYQLTVVDRNGCTSTKSVSVKVYRKIYIPDAFTPNGDGINDVFRIPFSSTLKLKEFTIFNRWGNKVFTTHDIAKGWDGTVNGRILDSNTYVYIIRGWDDKGPVFLKGTVQLIH